MTAAQPGLRYYLALGDSLAAGVQPTGDPAAMFRTAEGYPDQLLVRLRRVDPGLELVNLSCPGESTSSMIEGGVCPYDRGNQLDEALAFLDGHRGRVALVTLDIGFNDFPGDDLASIPAGMESITRNLPRILAAVREVAGPTVPLAGMTIYDPFLAEWLDGMVGRVRASLSLSAAIDPINRLLTRIYHAAEADIADVAGAFATADFETQTSLPGGTMVPLNVSRVLAWTWMSAPPPVGPDRHANTAGYAAIAAAFEAVVLPRLVAAPRA